MCDCCCGTGEMTQKESEKKVDEILEEIKATRKKQKA
jgi:polyhydroxyalkanoate synthesis regulator phasin